MAKRNGELKRAILILLSRCNEHGGGYWHRSLYMPDQLASSRQSITKSLNRLITEGLVIKRNAISQAVAPGQLNKRCCEYSLAIKGEK